MFRIVFNTRQQCHTRPPMTRCICLILRKAKGVRQLPKLDVAGSIPVSRSILRILYQKSLFS